MWMKKENGNLILGFAMGISTAMIIFNLIFILSYNGIESELETHLKSNTERIVLKDVCGVHKDIDGWYSFSVSCMNIELGYNFFEDMRFNPETKELVGYNVLEYKH